MKRCPKCAEKIQSAATVCRYCGAEQPKFDSSANWPALGVAGAILAVLFVIGRLGEKSEQQPVKPVETQAAIPGQACKGYHGEARNFAGLVKQGLRNPDSFEHVQTAYGPVENGIMLATMRYRATNGFGAIDTKVATGQVRASDCSAKVLAAE